MHKKLLFGLIGAIVATGAFANQVLTSQKYVDDADARKVDIAQGVGTNNANVGKTLVVNSQGNLELGTVSADNFVEDSITDGVTNKAPSENAVHDALENKQNTIATDMVDFTEPEEQIDYELPSLVTYDSANGVNGTRIGLVDLDNGGPGISFLAANMNPWDSVNAVYDNYVPTFRTVAAGLADIWNNMPNKLYWSNSLLQTPINNYNTTFSSASDTWPNDQHNYVPTAQTLANGLALKQNKIPASETTIHNAVTHQNQAAPSVVTNTATPGMVGQMAILTGGMYTYSAAVDDDFAMDDFGNGTGDDMLVTAKAVMNYVDGNDAKKQNKMTCTRWLPNADQTDDNCLLWDLGN